MSQKRLLFVVDSFRRFGSTRQLDLLTQKLATDFDVHIAVLDVAAAAPANLVAGDDPRNFHFLAESTPTTTIRSHIKSGLRLRKLIGRLQPDVLHPWCHQAERVAFAAAAEFPAIKRFVTELYLRPSGRMISKAYDLRAGKFVEAFIVSHDEVKKSLVELGYPEQKIKIIPSAIGPTTSDASVARQKLIQRCGHGEDVYLAGAVSELSPRTRLKDLIWATDLLTCIRDDVHFFIFGSGSQNWRLKKFADQTEAGDHVHFIDNEYEALELMSGLDFFWQSHINEPLPSAMCHAMLSGVPVISVYGPGTSELIDHQETGFATNVGARDEFARWSKFLLEKTDQAKQLADQGRRSVDGKFSQDEMVAAYRELY